MVNLLHDHLNSFPIEGPLMKVMLFSRIYAAIFLLLGVVSAWSVGHAQQPATSAAGARFVPGQVLIQFRSNSTEVDRQNTRNRIRAVLLQRLPFAASVQERQREAQLSG